MFIHPQTGFAEVWDVHRKRWIQIPPVDAREMLVPRGTPPKPSASTEDPQGNPAPSSLQFVKPAAPVQSSQEPQKPGEEPPEPYNFTKHTVPELRGFAEKAGIPKSEGMTKAELTEALSLYDYNPKTGVIQKRPSEISP